MVRASDCGSEGRGFESLYPPHKLISRTYAGEEVRVRIVCVCKGKELIKQDVGMSPSGKAPDFDSGIRWFKSSHPSHDS